MQRLAVDTPEPTAAACKQATGRSLQDWFAALDAAGGLAKGRRDLLQVAYAATGKDEWWATTLVVEYERLRGQQEKDGRPRGYSICSTKTIAAPLASVFAAFGDAALLDRWLGKGTKVAFAVGGTLQNRDGDQLTWTRIRPDKDLRATWNAADLAPGSELEVLFADKGKTGITLNHTRIMERRAADQLRAGWSACLDTLKTQLELP
jgi:uncharacterized protein YndB with AHSA1/START domain